MGLIMKSKLKELRLKKNLSVYMLSKLSGVPKMTINRIESEQVLEVPVRFLNALCVFFDCQIQDIIYFESDNKKYA